MGTTLVESASGDFQCTALLLPNHADVLRELVQAVEENYMARPIEVDEETEPSFSPPRDSVESAHKKMRSLD